MGNKLVTITHRSKLRLVFLIFLVIRANGESRASET